MLRIEDKILYIVEQCYTLKLSHSLQYDKKKNFSLEKIDFYASAILFYILYFFWI